MLFQRFIQSAVGFALALLATPLLVMLGIPMQNIIVIVLICSFTQALVGTGKLKSHVPWKMSIYTNILAIVGYICGLIALKRLISLDNNEIKLIIGILLCLIVFIILIFRVKSYKSLHWGWALTAFTVSGFITGLSGMGGPILAIWALSKNWSVEKIRAYLFSVFFISIPIQLIFLYSIFGYEIIEYIYMSLLLLPIVVIVAFIGIPIGNKLPKKNMRIIVLTILFLIGFSSILTAIFKV